MDFIDQIIELGLQKHTNQTQKTAIKIRTQKQNKTLQNA